MKKRNLLLVFFLISSFFAQAQLTDRVIKDYKTGDNILIGQCSVKGIKQSEVFKEIFKKEYAAYDLNDSKIEKITPLIENVNIRVVFGSWCHDSQREIPRFIKTLDSTHYNTAYLEMIAVNPKMQALTASIKGMDIQTVPTFIFYRNGEEIGRIIEKSKKSLEKDIYKILKP